MSELQLEHDQFQTNPQTFPIEVACCDWRDPLNVGSAFRLADAFGVQRLILGGSSPHPPHRKISRTARATEQWVPFEIAVDLPLLLQERRQRGYQLIGLEITNQSQLIRSYPFAPQRPIVLVTGAEQHGIPAAVLELLDACVHLPMYGRNSSMNVATALAIALYELSQQWPS